jgi:DNA-binding LacI/PurR family transcriptional regulator
VNKRFAGVLIIGGLPDELALTYHRKGVKVVLIDKHMSKKDISCVVPDNKAGTLDLARYLVNLGHRRIAFLGAAKDPVVDLRFNTFIQVLKDAGCSFQSGDYITGGYEIKPACIAVKQYLSSKRNNKPSAIFAINDEAAIGAMKALQEQGLRVPEDISVTGYDDISWAAHTIPPLTTVRIPREEMGRMAAQLLVGQIESRQTSSTITALNTELVVRESCAPVH